MTPHEPKLDWTMIRAWLAERAAQPWRERLEALADLPDFPAWLNETFPRLAGAWEGTTDRRRFLKLLGASLTFAGLTGCKIRPPAEQILPYVRPPAGVMPGQPLFFTTAMTMGGYARGLLVESHEGRPTKVEGNPDHPASLGATDAFAQASLQTLCDPDRAQTTTYQGQAKPYGEFLTEFRRTLSLLRARQGAGLRILTETITSPTLAAQLQAILTEFPQAVWHQYEPAARDNTRAGARQAFGADREVIYHFDRADVVLALDADFLMFEPGALQYAREFSARRKLLGGQTRLNRLYVVEPTPSNTGAVADHRLPLKAAAIEGFVRSVATRLQQQPFPASPVQIEPRYGPWLDAVVHDLARQRGTSLVLAGETQPPAVHALTHQINQTLGNVGQTVTYHAPVVVNPVHQLESLRQLVQALNAGQVELLVILSANPVYTAPADFQFQQALGKAGMRVQQSLSYDETSALCHWHIPEAHFLESWSDARAFDGSATIIQPLIAPLYAGKSPHELLAAFSAQPEASGYDLVRSYWQQQRPGGDFEQFWQTALRTGVIPPVASTSTTTVPAASAPTTTVPAASAPTTNAPTPITTTPAAPPATDNPQPAIRNPQSLELVFRLDPSIYDGRFANNGWLQELPKPLTKLTWDNAALLSPATARRLGLQEELILSGGPHGGVETEVVELVYQGRSVRAPVWIEPGQADDTVTVFLGYGRTRAGQLGTGLGFDAYALRTSEAPWFGAGLEVRRTGERYALACTQRHFSMEGRDLARVATLDEYLQQPAFAQRPADDPRQQISLYPEWPYPEYAWGMTVDLNACVGCNACVVACQAENNIPIVGKEEVLRAREMHWLRIDRYLTEAADGALQFMPVLCMHCEKAPCEVVCPVEATSHSEDGINEMTYNRCVGTRYCSNNCPYKVRRFNFFQYANYETPVVQLTRNPNVTVRSRGVMEKCTYCVQRIRNAQADATSAGRVIQDGEVRTACQAVCPTQAFSFGNLNDPQAQVVQRKAEPRNYGLLAELNTQPRTSYLAAVRNPNPELKTE